MAGPGNLDIAIVGGGVCGLTLAIGLQKRGVKAHIYEATAKFGEIGAGIALGANALNILSEIGVYEELSKHMADPRKVKVPGFSFVLGTDLHDVFYTTSNEGEHASNGVLRSVFLDSLVKSVDSDYTHFNKRCIRISTAPDSKKQIMHFKDGSTAEADVVLVANGVKSSIRGMVMGVETCPDGSVPGVSFSNVVSYRGLVPRERAEAMGVDTSRWIEPTGVIANGKEVVIYPVSEGKLINIGAFAADFTKPIGSVQLPPTQPLSEPVSTEELLAAFPESDFGPEIRALLGCIQSPNKWYINIVYPHLKTYVKGRVALLGDAAHGMLPFLGAGAGQGMEDAYLLAALLADPRTNPDNIEEVLQVYSDIRRPRSQRILDLSVESGRVSHGHGEHGMTKEGLIKDIANVEKWRSEAYVRTVNADVDQAVEILKADGTFAST